MKPVRLKLLILSALFVIAALFTMTAAGAFAVAYDETLWRDVQDAAVLSDGTVLIKRTDPAISGAYYKGNLANRYSYEMNREMKLTVRFSIANAAAEKHLIPVISNRPIEQWRGGMIGPNGENYIGAGSHLFGARMYYQNASHFASGRFLVRVCDYANYQTADYFPDVDPSSGAVHTVSWTVTESAVVMAFDGVDLLKSESTYALRKSASENLTLRDFIDENGNPVLYFGFINQNFADIRIHGIDVGEQKPFEQREKLVADASVSAEKDLEYSFRAHLADDKVNQSLLIGFGVKDLFAEISLSWDAELLRWTTGAVVENSFGGSYRLSVGDQSVTDSAPLSIENLPLLPIGEPGGHAIKIRVIASGTGAAIGVFYGDDCTCYFRDALVTLELFSPAAGETENAYLSVGGFASDFSLSEIRVIKTPDKIYHPAIDATCVAAGNIAYYTCSICGKNYSDAEGQQEYTGEVTIPAKGHTEAVDRGYPATCTEDGLTDGKHCTECGTVTVAQEVIRATGHKRVVTEAGYPATCTEDGMSDRIECSVCGAVLQEARVIRATGHKEEIDAGYPATCSSDGLTEGKHCSVCGEILVEQKVIPSSGIAHTPGHPATCTEGQYCLVCGEELAPAKGHTVVKIAAEAATCTRDGHTEGSYCSTCFEVLEAPEKIPATGHREEIDPAVAATCTEAGLTEGKHCSVCGEVLLYQYPTFPTGHREKIVEGKEATCTESGKTMGIVCETCGEVLLEQKVIPAKGHLTSEATCETGSECLRCGEALSAALGHRYADEHTCHDRVCENCGEIAKATTAHTGGSATCTERAVCANCGEAYGEKKAHTYADGVCTECKAQIAVLKKEEEGGCSGSLGIGSAIGLLITAAAACVLRKKRG